MRRAEGLLDEPIPVTVTLYADTRMAVVCRPSLHYISFLPNHTDQITGERNKQSSISCN